jgi:hypothetical protein
MNATTMRAVLAALTARWDGDLEGVDVIYGPRVGKTVTGPRILTVGTVSFTSAPSTFGDTFDEQHSDEVYTIACAAEATLRGATAQETATDAALRIYEAAQVSLAGPDETLGVPLVLWARMTGSGSVIPATDAATVKTGRSAVVTFSVQVMAAL